MSNCRELAARVLISLAAANLVLPLSLLFCCLDCHPTHAGDSGGTSGKAGTRSVHAQAGMSRAKVAGRRGGKDVGGPLQRPAIGLKHRLHLGRAAEFRTKDRCDHLSPFVHHAASRSVANTAAAIDGSRHAYRASSTLDRCIDLSRLLL